MRSLRTFGECLGEMMKRHLLTPSALADRLEMRNVITISRLLRDETSENRLYAFLTLLRTHPAVFLPDEIARLESAVAVNRLGKRSYKVQRSIYDLLFSEPAVTNPPMLIEKGCSLGEYFSRLSKKEPLQVLCFNCCESDVFAPLQPLISDPERVVEMNHYVCMNEDTSNPALIMQVTDGLLFNNNYHLHLVTDQQHGSDANFFKPHAMLIKQGMGPRAQESALLFEGGHTVRVISDLQRLNLFDRLIRMIGEMRPLPVPVEYAVGPNGEKSQRDCLLGFYRYERNRAIFQIRPEIPKEFFPPEALLSAGQDTHASDVERRRKTARELEPLLTARYANLCHKAKPTFCVCSYAETARFLETGMLCDHFCGMRPFNEDELRLIMDSYLRLIESNPRHHLYFLKEDRHIHRYHFIGYEGLGVLACRHATNSSCQDAQKLLISDSVFLSQYIDFFTGMLLPESAHTREESVEMLKQLRGRLG